MQLIDWSYKARKEREQTQSLRHGIGQFKENRNIIYSKWKSEKDVVDNVQAIKTEIEDYKYEPNVPSAMVITEK
jgi:ATP-dependent Clp protease ATP-binding subunit ClpB